MALKIVVKSFPAGKMNQLTITGMKPGVKYDLMRLSVRYLGETDQGQGLYERETPDRKALWSSVAHRVGWTAPGSGAATVRDYECPIRATQYFIVESSQTGPHEYTNWTVPYPVSRGFLCPTVIHFAHVLSAGDEMEPGHIIIRSTAHLGKYITACVVSLDELKYTARGTELAVMGSQYPVYVADTREALRGSITIKVDTLDAYNSVREIVFPNTGSIMPVVFNAGRDPVMLLDDMRVIPLDVSIEQASQNKASVRFIHIDYVQIDGTHPLMKRTGDNDDLIKAPVANFSISDTTPAKGQWVTLTDKSSGQYDTWDWTVGPNTSNPVGHFYTKGPHKVRWTSKGHKLIKLRVSGAAIYDAGVNVGSAGADTIIKSIDVH